MKNLATRVTIYVVADQATADDIRHHFRKRGEDDFEPGDAIAFDAGMVKWFQLCQPLPDVPVVPNPMVGKRYQTFTWFAGGPYWQRLRDRYPDAELLEQVGRFRAQDGVPIGIEWTTLDPGTGAGEYQGEPNVRTPAWFKRVIDRVPEYDPDTGVEIDTHQWTPYDTLNWCYGQSLNATPDPAAPSAQVHRELWELCEEKTRRKKR